MMMGRFCIYALIFLILGISHRVFAQAGFDCTTAEIIPPQYITSLEILGLDSNSNEEQIEDRISELKNFIESLKRKSHNEVLLSNIKRAQSYVEETEKLLKPKGEKKLSLDSARRLFRSERLRKAYMDLSTTMRLRNTQDITFLGNINLVTAYNGLKKNFTYRRFVKCHGSPESHAKGSPTCKLCGGRMYLVEETSKEINIPSGILDEELIVVNGIGNYDVDSDTYGNLNLLISVFNMQNIVRGPAHGGFGSPADLYTLAHVEYRRLSTPNPKGKVIGILGEEIDYEIDSQKALGGSLQCIKGHGMPHRVIPYYRGSLCIKYLINRATPGGSTGELPDLNHIPFSKSGVSDSDRSGDLFKLMSDDIL